MTPLYDSNKRPGPKLSNWSKVLSGESSNYSIECPYRPGETHLPADLIQKGEGFMKRSRIAVATVLLMLLVSVLSACSGSSSTEVVTFGVALPLTGPLSPEGQKHIHGYELWRDTVNAQGGIKVGSKKMKVEFKQYDYKSDTATAVKLIEKLIAEDGVRLMFGPFGSGHAKAASAVTEKYKVPMIAPSASSVEVYTQGFKYLFGTFTPNNTLTEPLSDIAASKGVKTIGIIARNDLFPLAIAKEAEASAKKRGMNVVYFEQYAIGATDFSAVLNAIKQANPDWLFATGYAQDLIQIGKQMKELDVNVKMNTMIAGAAYKEFIDALGKDAEYVTTAAWWHPAVTFKGQDVFGTTADFVKKFEEKYKYTPDYPIASAAAVGAIFQAAIEKAGSVDPEKVREALSSLDIMTFYGPVKFSSNGQMAKLDPPVMQILGGKHVPLHPKDIKQKDIVYPIPAWNKR